MQHDVGVGVPLVLRSVEGLRAILDDEQPMLVREASRGPSVDARTEEVSDHDHAGARLDRARHRREARRERAEVELDEHRHEPVCARDVGHRADVRREQDLVSARERERREQQIEAGTQRRRHQDVWIADEGRDVLAIVMRCAEREVQVTRGRLERDGQERLARPGESHAEETRESVERFPFAAGRYSGSMLARSGSSAVSARSASTGG